MTFTPHKDPEKVRAGKIGATKRWGEQPRVARLDELDPRIREAVMALIRADAAARAANEKDSAVVSAMPAESSPEVRRGGVETQAA